MQLSKKRYFLTVAHAILLALFTAMNAFGCKSTQTNEDEKFHKITLEEYNSFDWQRQVETIENIAKGNSTSEDEKIIASGLADDDTAVIVSALIATNQLGLDEFLPQARHFLKYPDPIIRWRALLVIEKLGTDDSFRDDVASMLGDTEWMVREAAFRTLRNYKKERSEKKYFYPVLFKLNEKNPQVVVEIYRTLVWYDDAVAWPYLNKRSYHCKTVSELILVMRELARTKTREAQVRLKTLTRSQSAMVRNEAEQLLSDYY
ncbi:MAG: hypothetical protein LDLANPLL_00479 [Turneriella sp.]|nr:hypothetical protein [Turneriella sp.]